MKMPTGRGPGVAWWQGRRVRALKCAWRGHKWDAETFGAFSVTSCGRCRLLVVARVGPAAPGRVGDVDGLALALVTYLAGAAASPDLSASAAFRDELPAEAAAVGAPAVEALARLGVVLAWAAAGPDPSGLLEQLGAARASGEGEQ